MTCHLTRRLELCTFTLAVALGAVLLLPFSIISNEVLLSLPRNYYIQWLNGSLIHGTWLGRGWVGHRAGNQETQQPPAQQACLTPVDGLSVTSSAFPFGSRSLEPRFPLLQSVPCLPYALCIFLHRV